MSAQPQKFQVAGRELTVKGSGMYLHSQRMRAPLESEEANRAKAALDIAEPFAASGVAGASEGETGVRIVIADDKTLCRESLRMLLEIGNGFEVIGGCSDAQATLDMVRTLKPDVLLLDYSLPHEPGTELLAELRECNADVKVIVLCHTISQDETIAALRMGARGIVMTTKGSDSLIECIHRVVDGEYWLGKDGLTDLVHALCDSNGDKRLGKNRFGLTKREIEIIQAVLEGSSNPEIAANFSLSEQTVKHHLSHIFDKLGVYSRLELALFAVNHDIESE